MSAYDRGRVKVLPAHVGGQKLNCCRKRGVLFDWANLSQAGKSAAQAIPLSDLATPPPNQARPADFLSIRANV
jgi:hypothetical protein